MTIVRIIHGLLELVVLALADACTRGAAGRVGMRGSIGLTGVAGFLEVVEIADCGRACWLVALDGVTNGRLGAGRDIPLMSLILPLLSIFVVYLK